MGLGLFVLLVRAQGLFELGYLVINVGRGLVFIVLRVKIGLFGRAGLGSYLGGLMF